MVYVALLRGINVGGKNMIKMAALKLAFEELGLQKVQTYIQSGNVLFQSDAEEEKLRSLIEAKIEKDFSFSIHVVLRTADELGRIINHCPFTEEEITQAESASTVESLYLSFLSHHPEPDKLEKLDAYKTDYDKFIIIGRDVYLLFYHSIRDSKLANNLNKLDASVTTRNLNTVRKLYEIAQTL